ncbi:unnamed protein product [Amoebophrya sp. A25]|nr:unnamed protein product [Amoebophrya sp. A25]|eukprot:GSA25T00007509001.1
MWRSNSCCNKVPPRDEELPQPQRSQRSLCQVSDCLLVDKWMVLRTRVSSSTNCRASFFSSFLGSGRVPDSSSNR